MNKMVFFFYIMIFGDLMKIVIAEKNEKDYLYLKDLIENWGRKRKESVHIYWYHKLYYQIPSYLSSCDLIFLEIDMKEINGYEFSCMLRKNSIDIPLVFQTKNSSFALESYNVQAMNYLLKPVEERRIEKILDQIVLTQTKKEFVYTFKNKIRRSAYDDILYIETSKHCLYIQCLFHQERCYLSLKEIEKQLDQRFFRCHRSYIINLDYVKSVESTKCILQNNQEIFISKKYQNDLKYHFLKNVK